MKPNEIPMQISPSGIQLLFFKGTDAYFYITDAILHHLYNRQVFLHLFIFHQSTIININGLLCPDDEPLRLSSAE